MKHHIAIKFLAVILAALALLGALASGAGIIGLAASDLYEGSVEALYQENMHATRQDFAVNLAHRYASLNLGKLPAQYLNNYYGLDWMYDTFRYGYFYYTIYNEHGDMVETTMTDVPAGGTYYEMAVTDIRYRSILRTLTEDGTAETTPPETNPPETTAAPENTEAPDDTTATANTEALEATVPAGTDYAVVQTSLESEIGRGTYYDYDREEFVNFLFTYEHLPPYTVTLYLLPGAVPEEYAWTLLGHIWAIRYELFYILAGSLLLFAIAAVYLCCAAGRKPGQEEVRAGGLNRIPLDLYAGAVGFAILLAAMLTVEGGEYLLRNSPKIFLPVMALVAFACCLLLVAFCFACAAQFKTPGGFWWRNTLVGYFFQAAVLLEGMLVTVLKQCFPWVGKFLRTLWVLSWRALRWFYQFAECGLTWLFVQAGKGLRWLGAVLRRFLGLLPLTWQWLLGGMMLLIMCMLAWANRRDGWGFVWLILSFGLILFVSQCFGILLEATKRMSKGDLDGKVNDRILVGCFKEFAGDLNALANVAVVAAQKQLKSERMKTELITNVSHDIKTPLTSIINYVDLLQKPHTPEEQETYLEVLSRQSQQLKKLIEDLMEMSKASTGNMSVDIVSVNAGEAINQALGEFADKLDKVSLIPVFRQPEEPVYMKADGRLVWRVLSNLLSNAVKYALPGTRLYIDLMELDGKVVISLKNISREALNVSADELLERFVRGDISRNTEGSGLGLNIAQSLMELQKGQLQLLVDGDLFKVTLVFPAVPM